MDNPTYIAGEEKLKRGAVDSCATLLAILLVGMLWSGWRGVAAGNSEGPRPPENNAIDPNLAPWWELAVLPGIGETTARDIVAYRNFALGFTPGSPDRRVFISAVDLAKVAGIGPKTVEQIKPHVACGGS